MIIYLHRHDQLNGEKVVINNTHTYRYKFTDHEWLVNGRTLILGQNREMSNQDSTN